MVLPLWPHMDGWPAGAQDVLDEDDEAAEALGLQPATLSDDSGSEAGSTRSGLHALKYHHDMSGDVRREQRQPHAATHSKLHALLCSRLGWMWR